MGATRGIPAWVVGEFVGTFILVFFGCGSVCAAVTTGAEVGVFQVAIVWGIGIALAIHLTASLSGAHLNPVVTVAAGLFTDFKLTKWRTLWREVLGMPMGEKS